MLPAGLLLDCTLVNLAVLASLWASDTKLHYLGVDLCQLRVARLLIWAELSDGSTLLTATSLCILVLSPLKLSTQRYLCVSHRFMYHKVFQSQLELMELKGDGRTARCKAAQYSKENVPVDIIYCLDDGMATNWHVTAWNPAVAAGRQAAAVRKSDRS